MTERSIFRKIIPQLTDRQISKFWSRITIGAENECWPWTGTIATGGYGDIYIGPLGLFKAHRVAFFLTYGKQPTPNCLHSCDNPPCCNPKHFFEGTDADNVADMVRKGRQATGDRNGTRLHPETRPRGNKSWLHIHKERLKGEDHPNAKITEADVFEIRKQFTSNPHMSVTERANTLAFDFGITEAQIYKIVHARAWKHLNLKPLLQHRLTEAQVLEIRNIYSLMSNVPSVKLIVSLARQFETSRSAVEHIVYGTSWKHLNLPSLKRKPTDS